jgi:hypothetical protein
MITLLCIDNTDGEVTIVEAEVEQFSIRSAIEAHDGDVDAFLNDPEYGGSITVSMKEGNKYVTVQLEYDEFNSVVSVVGPASAWVDDDPRND